MSEILELLKELVKLFLLCIALVLWGMRELIAELFHKSFKTAVKFEERFFEWIGS